METTQEIQVGPVYRDPRGKVGRDGEQEHCFTVWGGAIIVHKRANSRARAEELRKQFVPDEAEEQRAASLARLFDEMKGKVAA